MLERSEFSEAIENFRNYVSRLEVINPEAIQYFETLVPLSKIYSDTCKPKLAKLERENIKNDDEIISGIMVNIVKAIVELNRNSERVLEIFLDDDEEEITDSGIFLNEKENVSPIRTESLKRKKSPNKKSNKKSKVDDKIPTSIKPTSNHKAKQNTERNKNSTNKNKGKSKFQCKDCIFYHSQILLTKDVLKTERIIWEETKDEMMMERRMLKNLIEENKSKVWCAKATCGKMAKILCCFKEGVGAFYCSESCQLSDRENHLDFCFRQ